MTKQEFFKKLSLAGSLSQQEGDPAEKLEAMIHEAYPDEFDMNQIIDFCLKIGRFSFERIETKSGDKLYYYFGWKRLVELWSDINCVVNAIGFVENCAGRIEYFFISEQGKFYNQDHKLIAGNMEEFAEYITTVEYDYHPETTQRTYDMLRFFGWYEGRHIDTTAFEQEVNRRGIELSKEQLDFFGEFSGLYFSFDSLFWCFDSLEEILTKDKYYVEESSNIDKNQYKIIYCGVFGDLPIAITPNGIINLFWAIPQGRTTMECINNLCESVNKDCKWRAPKKNN